MSVQIKINSATFSKNMQKGSKERIRKFLFKMHEVAALEIGEMTPKLPVDRGRLWKSYSTSKDYQKKMVSFGTAPSGGFEDVVYARWIETGRRRGKNGKTIYRKGTKGIGEFEKAKKNILKKIKKIKL